MIELATPPQTNDEVIVTDPFQYLYSIGDSQKTVWIKGKDTTILIQKDWDPDEYELDPEPVLTVEIFSNRTDNNRWQEGYVIIETGMLYTSAFGDIGYAIPYGVLYDPEIYNNYANPQHWMAAMVALFVKKCADTSTVVIH